MNQNLTLLLVCRRTLKIMIDAKRCVVVSTICIQAMKVLYLVEMAGGDSENVDVSLTVAHRDQRLLFLLLRSAKEGCHPGDLSVEVR